MKLNLSISLLLLCNVCLINLAHGFDDDDDNEFADFENDGLDNEPEIIKKEIKKPEIIINNNNNNDKASGDNFMENDDDGIVEDEFDNDEFENFDGNDNQDNSQYTNKKSDELKLTITKVPHKFHNWQNYWIELLFVTGLVVYFINYTMGKGKNIKIVNSWYNTHKSFLEENFSLVGDDRKERENSDGGPVSGFLRESDSIFSLWCSGRTIVEGMLVELKLIKRQDLMSITMSLLKKVSDQVQIKVEMSKDSMDSFVFAVCNKKSGIRLFKDMTDLKQYCINVMKADEKFNLPEGFSLLSEIAEASSGMLDSRLLAMLSKYSTMIESIHISDQYSGIAVQDQDAQQAAKPETKKVLILTYNFSEKTDMNDLKQLMQLVIYLIEKLKRFKLSREVAYFLYCICFFEIKF
jgi:hypothetical protein